MRPDPALAEPGEPEAGRPEPARPEQAKPEASRPEPGRPEHALIKEDTGPTDLEKNWKSILGNPSHKAQSQLATRRHTSTDLKSILAAKQDIGTGPQRKEDVPEEPSR